MIDVEFIKRYEFINNSNNEITKKKKTFDVGWCGCPNDGTSLAYSGVTSRNTEILSG